MSRSKASRLSFQLYKAASSRRAFSRASSRVFSFDPNSSKVITSAANISWYLSRFRSTSESVAAHTLASGSGSPRVSFFFSIMASRSRLSLSGSVRSVAVAAQVVTNLQHVVARGTDPLQSAVISVSKISGGSAPNVIPDSVELVGTVRVFDEEIRDRIEEAMERVVQGITEAHGATYSWSYQRGYRPVVNDEGLAAVIEESVRGELGNEAFEEMRPKMAGDDFSAYQQVAPGAYFFVGARNEEEGIIHPHHHPRFYIDERSLQNGLRVFLRAALALLDAKQQRNDNGETSS